MSNEVSNNPLESSNDNNITTLLGDVPLCASNETFFLLLQDDGELHIDINTNLPWKKRATRFIIKKVISFAKIYGS